MKDAILALDVGTSSCKAVLFDTLGNEISRATSPAYHNSSPQPGWVEQDPDEVWQALTLALREAVQSAPVPYRVGSVCLAAQSGSTLPADSNGEPVYPLITWLDGRSESTIQAWQAAGLEEKVKSLSGWSLYAGLPLSTIAWIQDNLPEISPGSCRYFSVNDFLAFRLTGKFASNPSNAGGMQLLDITTGAWHPDLCQLAGINTGQLSPVAPSGMPIAAIRPSLCQEFGLPEGTPLINGGHDQACTALGLGITEPGKLLLACGTAWVYSAVITDPAGAAIPGHLDVNFHVIPERWIISQSLGGLGASLEWWLGQAWSGGRRERYQSLDQMLLETSPNQELFFIPLTGGHDGPATTRTGGFVGLRLHHTRADMARAIMESAGYELAWALDSLQGSQHEIKELYLVGGASSSSVWPQILADILGLPIHIPAYDNWPAVGAAVLAGLATGVFDTPQQGAAQFHKKSRVLKPQTQQQNGYQRSTALYRQAKGQLRS